MSKTKRRALLYYLVTVSLTIVVVWGIALFVSWGVGLALMTLLVLEHARATVRWIRRQ